MFHAFTYGCDSTSSFKFKGKRYSYKTFQKLPEVIAEFANLTNSPFLATDRLIAMASKFVCRLYSSDTSPATQTGNTSNSNDINVVRMEVFCQKTKDVERIPPTADAVLQHLKRSSYQASIWNAAHISEMSVPNPELHGWMVEDGKLVPIWVTTPMAKDVFNTEIKCSCTKVCSACKCCFKVHTNECANANVFNNSIWLTFSIIV